MTDHYLFHEQEGDRLSAVGRVSEALAAYEHALALRPQARWIVTKQNRLRERSPGAWNGTPVVPAFYLFLPYHASKDENRAPDLDECIRRNLDCGLFARIILLVDDDSAPPQQDRRLQMIRLDRRPRYQDWVRLARRICPDQIAILANSGIHFDNSLGQLYTIFSQDPKAFVVLPRIDLVDDALIPHPNPQWAQDSWAMIPHADSGTRLEERLDIPLGAPNCDNRATYVFATEGYTIYNPFPSIRAIRSDAPLTQHKRGADEGTLIGGMILAHPSDTPQQPARLEAAIVTADNRELLTRNAATDSDADTVPPGGITKTSKFVVRDRMTQLSTEMEIQWRRSGGARRVSEPIISYCIPVMGRLDDLKGTLGTNLAVHEGLEGVVEFLIILFGDSAEILAWIEDQHRAALDSGLLRVVTDPDTLDSWHFGKAKNAFRPHLNGQVYSSLDADNFVTLSETRRLLDIQDQFQGYFLFHHFSGQWGDGTSGRISMPTAIYRHIGYDPGLLHRQFDEINIMLRVLKYFPDLPVLCLDRQRNFLTLSNAVRTFAEAEGFAHPILELPNYKRNAPLNPRGNDYVAEAPELRFMGEFNAALTGYRAASSAEQKSKYLAQAHFERRRLLDAMPTEILLDSFFRKTGRPEVSPMGAGDIALFACVKDEGHFLPEFLQHYRARGVRVFFIIDDGSADPVELSFPDPDVHVFHPKVADFRTAKTLWMEALMKAHLPEGGWALVVDADEFIDLPTGTDSFATLARQLEGQGRDFAPGLMLDLLPDPATAPERLANVETDFQNLFTHCGNFPGAPTPEYADYHSIRWGFGPHARLSWQVDIRYHAFGTFDSLRKIPFLRWWPGRHLNQGFHTLHHADKAQDPGHEIWTQGLILPVRHYKLMRLFSEAERDRMLQTAGQYHERTAGNITRIFSGNPGQDLLARMAGNLVPVGGFAPSGADALP